MHLLDLVLAQPRGLQDLVPRRRGAQMLGEGLVAGGVRLDELPVQDGARLLVLGLDQHQVQRLEEGQVATGPDLQELVGNGRAPADDAARLLGVLEAHEPGLGQRIDGDDTATAALGLLQRGQHPRMVGAGVLSYDEDEVGVVQVVERDAALADAQGLVQR